MDDKLFAELLESIKEAGAIKRGEMPAARVTRIDKIEVREIRNKLNLSQSQFALLLGVRVRTLQNWELGTRSPAGPSRRLLKLAEKYPNIFFGKTVTRLEKNNGS
ncbi:MAG: NadS family protein [Anaerolineaceae bacterium]|nr:NadS family protein [Anaerolineaceae bacterium]